MTFYRVLVKSPLLSVTMEKNKHQTSDLYGIEKQEQKTE
jgi:hypothetical protein